MAEKQTVKQSGIGLNSGAGSKSPTQQKAPSTGAKSTGISPNSHSRGKQGTGK